MTTTPLPRTSAQIRLAHANDRITKLEQARADLEEENQRLRETLIEVERRLTLLIDRGQHKLLDVVARDKALAALEKQP